MNKLDKNYVAKNDVAIHVKDSEEVEKCDAIMGMVGRFDYFYKGKLNNSTTCICYNNGGGYSRKGYFEDIGGYTIIEAADFIKFNTKPKFSIGDKVLPLCKTTYGSLDESAVWHRALARGQKFLYYAGLDEDGEIMLNDEPNELTGDYFNEGDFIHYVEVEVLPKEYIIRCYTVDEFNKAAWTIKGEVFDWCDSFNGGTRYVYRVDGYKIGNVLHSSILPDVRHLPVLNFKEWNELHLAEQHKIGDNLVVRGCKELSYYFIAVGVNARFKNYNKNLVFEGESGGLDGYDPNCYFYIEDGKWKWFAGIEGRNKIVVSLEEYKSSIVFKSFNESLPIIIPEKWVVAGGTKLMNWAIDEMNDRCNCGFGHPDFYYTTNDDELLIWDHFKSIPDGYTEITFEQFITHKEKTLKGLEMKKESKRKEILGYKLKSGYESYKDACETIHSGAWIWDSPIQNPSFIDDLKKAGVLDLWFEPVYKPEFESGAWVKVIDGGVGARGANGFIGKVCSKSVAMGCDYGGRDSEDFAELYVYNTVSSWGLCSGYEVVKATDVEIEQFLKSEAIKRGFVEGVKVKWIDFNNKGTKFRSFGTYSVAEDILWATDNGMYVAIIYKNGEWSEVLTGKVKSLSFGAVAFVIHTGDDFATTKYGKVTKKEVEEAIRYIENPPKLAGYGLKLHNLNSGNRFDLKDFGEGSEHVSLAFGCQDGKLSELKNIYKAFEE